MPTDAAASAYPNDPNIKEAQAVLDNPQSTPQQKAMAANGAENRMKSLDTGVKSRSEQSAATEAEQKSNPLFKFESDPKTLADPGAQAALGAYIADPKNAGNVNGLAQAKMLISKAGIAQQHEIDLAGLKAGAMKTAGVQRGARLRVDGAGGPDHRRSAGKQAACDVAHRRGRRAASCGWASGARR